MTSKVSGRRPLPPRTKSLFAKFDRGLQVHVEETELYPPELYSKQSVSAAIVIGRKVLELCLPGHPHRFASLNNLVIYLSIRYDQVQKEEDLEEAIALARETLQFCSSGEPGRSQPLNNLAVCLSTRYDLHGEIRDFDEAVVLGREALRLHPRGYPHRPQSLNNLAVDLLNQYERLGSMTDLDEVIALDREALELCPLGSPHRSTCLNNLAVDLFTRYKQIGGEVDLNEVVFLHQEALELRPPPHPYRLQSLTNLVIGLSARFRQLGTVIDADAALVLHREVLELCPQGHADRAIHLDNLRNLRLDLCARCDALEYSGHLTEAVECFRRIQDSDKLIENVWCSHDEQVQWELDFRKRCIKKLVKLTDAERNGIATQSSNAEELDPMNPNNLETLLEYSDEVIKLDPSSHIGYEGRHAALHGMGRYSEAYQTFRMMLSMIERSANPQIRELRREYVDATPAIQKAIGETIRGVPRVLIDTITGDLYNKTRQAAAFEELAIYDELRSSMTTQLDYRRIREEVQEFYRYVMLSHKWQPHEPTFQTVENISIFELPASPTFSKLINFSKLVHTLGFKWAWIDTCCVNRLDEAVRQESLVAMFRWYRGSSLTVIHLLGVSSESQVIGSLRRSIWNTRGWTYQEYLASETVQFYTEDWKPYLGLKMFNHKESPIILSEMEEATNFRTKELVNLQPGFDRAREKLYLASKRQTAHEEDRAYSLFGIFNVALPVFYGEGNQAIGRLLEHVLTRSDNVTLLAWTGQSGSQHSYLPSDLVVYDQIVPPHIRAPMEMADVGDLVTASRTTLPDISLVKALYERCNALPPLSLLVGRLRLPGIVFPLADLVRLSQPQETSSLIAYRGTSPMLGDVEITTRDDLSGLDGSLLIHPWISPLLDLDFSRGEPLFDEATRALRLIVRLRQPFGALMLAPLTRAHYKRVATDSLIMVRVREETSLSDLMDGIRTVDIE